MPERVPLQDMIVWVANDFVDIKIPDAVGQRESQA